MLLEDTLSMYFPGMWCMVQSGDNWNSFTPTGFSGYDVDVLMKGPFDPLVLGGPPTHTFHIGMSKLDTGTALFSMNGNEFVPPETPDKLMEFYSPKEIRKELADLPASARLDVSLSLETYLTADQVAQLMKDYPDASFEWVALKGQEAGYYVGVAGGMNLYTTGWDAFSGPQAQERYAGYYLPPQEEVTGKALEQSLIARLRLLSDHPDFLRMMESRFQHIISPELVEERLARAEQEWSCYGILLTVGRDDLTRMLDQLPVTQAVVNDVRVSRFQKN